MELPAVAILAGGMATRLGKLARRVPKAMLEVMGKPFIEHQLEQLKAQGIGKVVICTGHMGEKIQEHVQDGARYGLQVSYSPDGEKLLGTAGALKKALPLLGETFFVLYGDSYLSLDFAAMADEFQEKQKQGMMAVYKNENRLEPSNVVFRNGFVIRYEKNERDPEMLYIDYGLSLLRAQAFNGVMQDETLDLTEVYRLLVSQGEMAGFPVTERFYQIGTEEGLEELRQYLAAKN